eukprot:8144684-Pyramimonas_sp.AAC.1
MCAGKEEPCFAARDDLDGPARRQRSDQVFPGLDCGLVVPQAVLLLAPATIGIGGAPVHGSGVVSQPVLRQSRRRCSGVRR